MKTNETGEIIELMFRISRILKQEMVFKSAFAELSVSQIQTLIYIHQNQPVSMGSVANYFHIELPSATSLLNTLTRLKLVKRAHDRKDRRIVTIVLTHTGTTLLDKAMIQRRRKIEKILSYLSGAEKKQLHTLLDTLYTRVQS